MKGNIGSVMSRGYARLAFCLIDMNGQDGRVDGSIGVSLSEPFVELFVEKLSSDRQNEVSSLCDNGDSELLRSLCHEYGEYYPNLGSVRVVQRRGIARHVGLGSGTQVRLALLHAFNVIAGSPYKNGELLRLSGRGGASGVGVWAHEHGGIVLDCGHAFGPNRTKKSFLPSAASDCGLPSLVWREEMPEDWKFLCVTPKCYSGMSGQDEIDLFSRICPIDRSGADRMASLILMGLVPAVLERDIGHFRYILDEIQKTGFKKIVWSLQPKEVMVVHQSLAKAGFSGIGISSLGPTLYWVAEDDELETSLDEVEHILELIGIDADVWSTSVKNNGAKVSVM